MLFTLKNVIKQYIIWDVVELFITSRNMNKSQKLQNFLWGICIYITVYLVKNVPSITEETQKKNKKYKRITEAYLFWLQLIVLE